MQCLGLKRHSRQRGGKNKSLRNRGKGPRPTGQSNEQGQAGCKLWAIRKTLIFILIEISTNI